MYPRLDLPNAAFRNRGELAFHDARQTWHLDEPGVRQGMAVADLDRDGDLDIVQNGLAASRGCIETTVRRPAWRSG